VFYAERIPAAPLFPLVRVLWYARAPDLGHRRERVLPTGRVQIIINLGRDFLHDCSTDVPDHRTAPSLIVGGRSVYEIVDSSDMTDLIGVSFAPGGFGAFVHDASDLFSNRSVPLEDACSAEGRQLRERLIEAGSVNARFACLEQFLCERLAASDRSSLARMRVSRQGAVEFALGRFRRAPSMTTVSEVAGGIGWSERRFSQVFREEVGLAPKVWCRIQRFQRAVRMMHAGRDVPWSELSLDCGFYDQAHFSNEFRAFSGVNPTAYSAQRTIWANHIRVD
jgi:AraC-like DNA-binding protein